MDNIAKKLKGFKGTHYYNVIMQLLDDAQKAGVSETIKIYASDRLDVKAVERMAAQTKVIREIISHINGLCDYADQGIEEENNEDKESIVLWRT